MTAPVTQRLAAVYRLITIIRGSVISCTANFGPSRVLPDSLTPP